MQTSAGAYRDILTTVKLFKMVGWNVTATNKEGNKCAAVKALSLIFVKGSFSWNFLG